MWALCRAPSLFDACLHALLSVPAEVYQVCVQRRVKCSTVKLFGVISDVHTPLVSMVVKHTDSASQTQLEGAQLIYKQNRTLPSDHSSGAPCPVTWQHLTPHVAAKLFAGNPSSPSAFPSLNCDYRSALGEAAVAAAERPGQHCTLPVLHAVAVFLPPAINPSKSEGGTGRECVLKIKEWNEWRLFVIPAAGSAVSQRVAAVETSQRGLGFFVFSSGVVRSPPVLSGVQAAGCGNGQASAKASCFVHLLMHAA